MGSIDLYWDPTWSTSQRQIVEQIVEKSKPRSRRENDGMSNVTAELRETSRRRTSFAWIVTTNLLPDKMQSTMIEQLRMLTIATKIRLPSRSLESRVSIRTKGIYIFFLNKSLRYTPTLSVFSLNLSFPWTVPTLTVRRTASLMWTGWRTNALRDNVKNLRPSVPRFKLLITCRQSTYRNSSKDSAVQPQSILTKYLRLRASKWQRNNFDVSVLGCINQLFPKMCPSQLHDTSLCAYYTL